MKCGYNDLVDNWREIERMFNGGFARSAGVPTTPEYFKTLVDDAWCIRRDFLRICQNAFDLPSDKKLAIVTSLDDEYSRQKIDLAKCRTSVEKF